MAADSESALAGSLTDLMTSLMVIFVLLLVAMLNNAHHQGQSSRDNLLQSLKQALGVQVQRDKTDPLALIIIAPEKLLNFGLGQATIPPGGESFLHIFVPKLAEVVCSPEFRDQIAAVTIEGFTDPSGHYAYNVGLGQQRAAAVVEKSLGDLRPGTERNCFETVLTASGKGNFGALENESVMAKERHVEFRVRVKSAEERSFQETVPWN